MNFCTIRAYFNIADENRNIKSLKYKDLSPDEFLHLKGFQFIFERFAKRKFFKLKPQYYAAAKHQFFEIDQQ